MYRLTCRENLSGRGLIPVRPADGLPDPASAALDRWVIFVHGFNNSRKDAEATWEETSRQLESGGIDVNEVILFFWPGDYSPSEAVAAMSYWLTVPIAEKTAQHLAAYLDRSTRDRSEPLPISFVAHSLGALVVLETLNLLRASKARVAIENVLLMAAAVPEGSCYRKGRYGDRFRPGGTEVVLHSLDDPILKFFFQMGQLLARRFPPRARRAVGRSGGPDSGPRGRWSDAQHKDHFDHGDYWKKSDSIAEIARVIQPKVDPYSRAEEWHEKWAKRQQVRQDVLTSHSPAEADELPHRPLRQSWLRT